MPEIIAKNLTKKYKDKTAVDALDLKIADGELFSLLGVNGAGKTTTVKMLSTLIKPTSGDILYDAQSISSHKNEIRAMINVSPQETSVAPNLSVIENLYFMAGVYEIDNKKQKIDELTEIFDLKEVLKQKARTLSGGWQRKLSIAMALINDPKVLYLDEPTLGLDVLARRELWHIIEGLKKTITLVLTTHYMEEAENLSDRVGIMAHGKLKCVGTPAELIEQTGSMGFEEAFVKIASEGETR